MPQSGGDEKLMIVDDGIDVELEGVNSTQDDDDELPLVPIDDGDTSPEALRRRRRRDHVDLEAWREKDTVLDIARKAREKIGDPLGKFRASVYAVRALRSFVKARQVSSEINPEILARLVRERNGVDLIKIGGVEGVKRNLRTSPEQGISDDPEELESQRKEFGSNTYKMPPPKRLWRFVAAASMNFRFLLMLLSAAQTLASDIVSVGIRSGWYDGASTAFAAVLVIIVTSFNDYFHARRFHGLKEQARNFPVEVIRNGRRGMVSSFSILVGDIVFLKSGDQVPADGLFLDGHSLSVDESDLNVDQSGSNRDSDPIPVHHKSPYLLSGSKIDGGNAIMVVTAVGMNTKWGQLMVEKGVDSYEKTPLQKRLDHDDVRISSMRAFAFLFVILLVSYFAGSSEGYDDSGTFKAGKTHAGDVFRTVLDMIFSAAIIVAADLPEGLAQGVTLTLTYAMKAMISDKLLLRRISACEKMGNVTAICSDKTGMLTLNEKAVVKAWAGGGLLTLRGPVSSQHAVCQEYYDMLFQGIAQNSGGSVFISPESGKTEVRGSPTEKAALLWGLDMGMQFSEVRSLSTVLQVQSCDSEKMKSGVAVKSKVKSSSHVHVHWKGAAEVILSQSAAFLRSDNSTMPIGEDEKTNLVKVIEGMAAEGRRCLAFGYMTLDSSDIPSNHDEQLNEWRMPEGPLILLAIIGMKDQCRPGVPDAVKKCQAAGIRVRMITGEHILTAKAIATECGILRGERDIAVEGVTLRNYSDEERKLELPNISVVARASPSDKLLIVNELRKLGEIVAVTGNGTKDAAALREADVGISMGIHGTQVAKDNSDIIVMDDNFVSVVKAVQWGRSVYFNIQRIIQFQFTMKLVTYITINTVAMASGDVPLPVVQLLWANLIVDIFGALALATDKPTDSQLHSPPIKPADPLTTNIMCRNILSQAMYQVIILLVLQFRGKELLPKLGGASAAKSINQTVIFNVFVLCQIFNEVNARKLEEKNVFEGILSNRLFLAIVGTTILFQVIAVEFLNTFASTVKLDWEYWAICILIGSGSWPIAFLTKFIPTPKEPNLVRKWSDYKKQLFALLKKFVHAPLLQLLRWPPRRESHHNDGSHSRGDQSRTSSRAE